MSAAALRAPAPWHRVARAEAAALLTPDGGLLLLVVLLVLTVVPLGPEPDHPFSEVRLLTGPLFFLPFLHWRGHGGRNSLDQAMPIGATSYDLIRVAAGAGGALAVLVVGTRIHVWAYVSRLPPGEMAGFAPGYTAALVLRGLAAYVLGSSIVLRTRRPGRVLFAVYVIGSLALLLAGGWETTTIRTSYAPDGTASRIYGSSHTLGKALLQLVLALAALGASLWLVDDRFPFSGWMRGRSVRGRAASGRATASGLPRQPAPLHAVALRQFTVQMPRMLWPMLLAAGIAAWYLAGGMGLGGLHDRSFYRSGFSYLMAVASLWPLLVWMDERGGHAWDEALPAGAFARRVAHAAAGLAWLEIGLMMIMAGHLASALAAGGPGALADVSGWMFPGVPLAVMALYCVGTVPVVLATRPVIAGIVTFLLLWPLLGAVHIVVWGSFQELPPLSPIYLIGALYGTWEPWSIVSALVWIPAVTVAAVAAIRMRVAVDQHGSTRANPPLPAS